MIHRVWHRSWLALFALIFVAGTLAAKDDQIDSRRWSLFYWQSLVERGLVQPNPEADAPPVIYNGPSDADGVDVPVITGNYTQSETSIFVNPTNNQKALNSNNSTNWPVSVLYGTSHFETANGATTWGGSATAPGGSNYGDPAAVINLSGTYFVGYINTSFRMGLARSTNEGSTWLTTTLPQTGSLDKEHVWVDNSPSSPYAGYIYDAWTNFSSPYGEIQLSRSTDGGVTFAAASTISTNVPAGSHHQGVNIQTGPDGNVYACWAVYQQWAAGQYAEDGIGFAKSTDGGATWPSAEQRQILGSIKGIRGEGYPLGSSANWPVRTSSFPVMAADISGGSRDGYLYIVWTNIGVPGINTGSDWDVYLIRSTDEGATWSTPSKVNSNTNSGRREYYPWISCDPVNGNLHVVFHDNRSTTPGTKEVQIWVANSTDGGLTWDENQVSDVTFVPAPIPGLASGYMGDYLGTSARDGKVYPVWADNRSGHVLTYSSVYDYTGGGGGGIPCEDISSFVGRCIGGGTKSLQYRVNLLNSTIWAGTDVTIDVDGTQYTATIVSNGTHSRASFQIDGVSVGDHTATLIDPDCGLVVNTNCAADGPSAEWEATEALFGDTQFDATVAPTTTRILGNYPNPFNPSTTIRYVLGEDVNVSVRVYNMLGQEVATLVNGFQKAGEQSVVWHGTNNFGQAVSSGLYIYRVQAGSLVMTEKMMFMK